METKESGADKTAAKIDRETAEAEFTNYCDNNGIAHDESELNDDEIGTFKDIKRRFIEACTEGRVEVDGRSLKYIISKYSPEGFRGEKITIKRPNGSSFQSQDSFKEKESIRRLHGFLSAQTGKDVSYFTKIDILDWKFFNAIAQLFLSL